MARLLPGWLLGWVSGSFLWAGGFEVAESRELVSVPAPAEYPCRRSDGGEPMFLSARKTRRTDT